MPFGLKNAAQSFQRFLDQVLQGLDFCFAYIGDPDVIDSDQRDAECLGASGA